MENMDLFILTTGLLCFAWQSNGQPAGHSGHGFDIQELTVGSFSVLDISPNDGTLSENEWNAMLDLYNSDGDNCTTSIEYSSHTGMPNFVAKLVYDELDMDKNGCLTNTEITEKYRRIDTDGNGEVTLQEYGNYYQKVFADIFSHMGTGPGHR